MKVNLLKETLDIISFYGKKPEDVDFVYWGTRYKENGRWTIYKEYMTWEDFVSQANKEYDNGFEDNIKVKESLTVVGDSWWLERRQTNDPYGSEEWWEFKSLPKKPKKYKKFSLFNYEED